MKNINATMCECKSMSCNWIGTTPYLEYGNCPLCGCPVAYDNYTYNMNYSMMISTNEEPWRRGEVLVDHTDKCNVYIDYNLSISEIDALADSCSIIADEIIVDLMAGGEL